MTEDTDEPPFTEDRPPARARRGGDGKREEAFFNKDEAYHNHNMRHLELGWLGRLIGASHSTPTHIACVAVIGGLLLSAVSLVGSYYAPDAKTAFWQTVLERSLAFSGASLAFIFGRGSVR